MCVGLMPSATNAKRMHSLSKTSRFGKQDRSYDQMVVGYNKWILSSKVGVFLLVTILHELSAFCLSVYFVAWWNTRVSCNSEEEEFPANSNSLVNQLMAYLQSFVVT